MQIEQKSFGDFTKERFGPNWVFAHRSTPALQARYNKPYCPVVVITTKQQRQLKYDYAREYGRDHDPQYWAMLSALRAIHAHAVNRDNCPATIEALAGAAIEAATKIA